MSYLWARFYNRLCAHSITEPMAPANPIRKHNVDAVLAQAFVPRDRPFLLECRIDPKLDTPLSHWDRSVAVPKRRKADITSFLMNYFLLIWMLWLSLTTGYAQSVTIDSLKRLIGQTKTDTARINLQNRLIGLITTTNIDSSIRLSNQTISYAHRIGYQKGEAKTWIRLAFSYCLKGDFEQGRTSLQKAQQILTTLPDLMLRCEMYSGYGALYGMQSKYDSAGYYFDKAIRTGEPLHHPSLSRFYQNAAVSYQMQSNHLQALAYQQKALTMAEQAHDANTQGHVLVNMGLTYKTMGDLPKAEQFLFRAVKMARVAEIQDVPLYAYSNLATLYEQRHDLKKAYQFAMQAATLGGQVGDQGIQAASLAKAASVLGQQRRFAEARNLARRALAIADSARQPLVTYQVNSVMGDLLKRLGNCREAIDYLEKGFAVLSGSDIYDEQIGVSYRVLSDCYEKTGQYSKALSAYRTSAEIADSVRSKENIRKATEFSMNTDFDRRQQLARVEQQKERAVATVKQVALLGGLILTMILAVVAYIAFRTKRRANDLLQKQKEQIEDALIKLKSTQTRLIQKEKMASLGELTAGIAHEIQNPLNFVNNFSEVSAELVTELEEEQQKPNREMELEAEILADLKQNLQKIHHHGGRASAIVKGMLEHSRTETGERRPTNLNLLADEYLKIAYHGLRAKNKEFSAELVRDFEPDLSLIEVVPQAIGRVLLNLYNNAFYAVKEKQTTAPADYQPTVTVSTRQLKGYTEIRVSDNGIGMPESVKGKIFQPFFTTKPTGEGTGLGLSLSYDIITKGHGGSLTVESEDGKGTTFLLQLLTAPDQ